MSEFAAFDLDRSTARAWSRFQARLADYIAEMGDDDMLVVEAEVGDEEIDGAAPYVQFAGFDEGSMVRGEVVSNFYLAEPFELDDEQCRRLEALGWGEPTTTPWEEEGEGSANYFVDVSVSEADRLAVMAVKALREVFGVAHPAFLDAGDLVPDPDDSPPPAPAVESEDDTGPLTVTPESADHLRELVDAALTPLFGSAPMHDEDDDIPVPWGSSLVFVRVDEDVPIVQLFSIVAEGVSDLERAAFEVGVLNRDVRFIKFVLVEDRVLAQVHLPAWPFVPEHLRTMLTGMSKQIDELDEDLVARIGGRRAFEPADDGPDEAEPVSVAAPDEVSDETALVTLLQLNAHGSEPLDAELVAGVCGFDQALVVRLLRETEREEGRWRRARDEAVLEGDSGEAQVCDHEMRAWENTSTELRHALRFVVERALGRTSDAGSSYTRVTHPRPAGSPGIARRRRKTLPPKPRPVNDCDDLLRFYDVEDLVELDDKLSEGAAVEFDVQEIDGGIEVFVEECSAHLVFPFDLADFRTMLDNLVDEATGAAQAVEGEQASS